MVWVLCFAKHICFTKGSTVDSLSPFLFTLFYFIIHIIIRVDIMPERTGSEGQLGDRNEKNAGE